MNETKPILIRLVSLLSAVALTVSLGWSASHCATFKAGKALLSQVASAAGGAHHHDHAGTVSRAKSGGASTNPSSSPAPPKGGQGSDHCKYCHAATGGPLASSTLLLPMVCLAWKIPSGVLQVIPTSFQVHSPPRGPPLV